MSTDLVIFFKALADANRLKMVGLLAQRGYSVEELAALLNLKAPTVSHHLSRLAGAGLVTATAQGYYSIYRLDRAALEAAARSLLADERLAAVTSGVDLDAYNRKVLADFSLPDGTLKEIPAQRKKLEIILRQVVKVFEPGVEYTEKQVNQALARFHADTATLRRELVGYGLMKREGGGGNYWVEQP
jgi:DNA-binding transcriptional ArsR family regulator